MAYAKGRSVSSAIMDTINTYQFPQHQHLNNQTRGYVQSDDFFWTSVQGDRKSPTNYERMHVTYQKWVGSQITLDSNGIAFLVSQGLMSWPISDDSNPSFSPNLYNTALGRVYDQLRGNIDLSIDGAQWRQTRATVKNLTDSMSQLSKAVNDVEKRYWRVMEFTPVRRKYSTFKRFLKTISGLWLQWVYGIKPTLSTLYELVEKAQKPTHNHVRIIGKANASASDSKNGSNFGNVINSHKGRVKIFLELAPVRDLLEDLAGITSLNPASFAWEMFPYSFVVDWVVDIGGYMRSMETAYLHGSNFVSGYTQTGYRWDQERTIMTKTGSIVYNGSGYGAKSIYSRSVLTSMPLPNKPAFEINLGVSRLLSAAALLSNFLPNSSRKRMSAF